MDVQAAISYVYLGIILGAMGGGLCAAFHPRGKPISAIKVLTGSTIGALASISAFSIELSKYYLLSLIMLGYVGASITEAVFRK